MTIRTCLQALLLVPPRDYGVTICDENAREHINYNADALIVASRATSSRWPAFFEIADRFRARGKKVVLGGPLTNLLPAECRPHCDVLFEGEAEYLYRRLYAPEAFAERLLGNLRRFHDVTYLPEAVRLDKLVTFWRLMRHYRSKGNKARRFFWGILRETLRHSPRSLRLVVLMLGMYKHFCELHTKAASWDPWAGPIQGSVPAIPVGTVA
jgi:hypothetical protein